MEINLAQIYQETLAQLRDAERVAAEFRGQMRLIERLLRMASPPEMTGGELLVTGAPLGEAPREETRDV